MKYLVILGRQPEISIAELEAQLGGSCRLLSSPKNDGIFGGPPPQPSPAYVKFSSPSAIVFARLGGTLKLAVELAKPPAASFPLFMVKLPPLE